MQLDIVTESHALALLPEEPSTPPSKKARTSSGSATPPRPAVSIHRAPPTLVRKKTRAAAHLDETPFVMIYAFDGRATKPEYRIRGSTSSAAQGSLGAVVPIEMTGVVVPVPVLLKSSKKPLRDRMELRHISYALQRYGRLSHPELEASNGVPVARLFYAWMEDGHVYQVVERGAMSLTDILATKVVSFDARQLVDDLLAAVNYVHSHGMIHTDLKPDNIVAMSFIELESKEEEKKWKAASFKLIDFDQVRIIQEQEKKADETQPIEFGEGDSRFLDQFSMRYGMTQATDVFALGKTFLAAGCDSVLGKRIIDQMMSPDAKQRPLIADVISRIVE